MEKIRFGIVGIGMMGRMHATSLQRNPHAEVVAVCARTESKVKAFQEEFGVPYGYTNVDELVNNPEVDAIVVATGADAHKAPCLAACKAKKHIFCEKPLAKTIEDCEGDREGSCRERKQSASRLASCAASTRPTQRRRKRSAPVRSASRSCSRAFRLTRPACLRHIWRALRRAFTFRGSSRWAAMTPTLHVGSSRAIRSSPLQPAMLMFAPVWQTTTTTTTVSR